MKVHRCGRLLGLLLLSTTLAGCYAWRTDPRDPREVVSEGPDRIRVTAEGLVADVAWPEIEGDSITGRGYGMRGANVTVPLDDVRSIEVRRVSSGKTVGAMVGIPFLAYIGSALVYIACCLHGAP
jgi:hypothetical protein